MQLDINSRNVSISDFPNSCLVGSTANALGDVISTLEQKFPFAVNSTPQSYSKFIIEKFNSFLQDDKAEDEVCFGLKCSADYLFDINLFLNNSAEKNKIRLTMQSVEIFRVHHNITKSVIPIDWNNVDYSGGLRIDNITSFYELFYGLLYYYAFNGLKLAKCEHCGRWFATDSFKNKYCQRKSPVLGFDSKNCEAAVRYLCQKTKIIRKSVYNSIRNQANNTKKYVKDDVIQSEIFDFSSKCDDFRSRLKETYSAEVFTEYLEFLQNYRAEMKRRAKNGKHKRNAHKRRQTIL